MKNLLVARILPSSILIIFACCVSHAQTTTPTIDVQGSADVKVVPDEVMIVFGIETSDVSLATAKSDNDKRVKKLLSITQDLKIDPRFVQTDFISIEPWEHEIVVNNERETRKEFRVRKNVSITLREVARFEELLSRALEGGVNFVHGVQFLTTELRKHRDQAREMAIQAAKEKAQLLASRLGRQVGEALRISEYGGGWYSTYNWWGQYGGYANAMSQVASQSGQSSYGEGGTIALGQITVSASVSVSFMLK
jgi:uncharacterized protein YggE